MNLESLFGHTKIKAKELIRKSLPLEMRKHLCLLLNHQKWLREDVRSWWTRELLRDFEEHDRNGYHRFLWSNHLGYALSYKARLRFGRENMVESRKIFFSDFKNHLISIGVNPSEEVQSVLELGCSLGYQLRYMETDLFPAATELVGIDIDRHAIVEGRNSLKHIGSKVQLICDDMTNLDRVLGNKKYDVIISTGVLMYLDEKAAFRTIDAVLQHCRTLAALSNPAHPDMDNGRLEHSLTRGFDGSFIHNLDAMVAESGGTVVGRRWEGNRKVDGQTIYFVFGRNNSFIKNETQLG